MGSNDAAYGALIPYVSQHRSSNCRSRDSGEGGKKSVLTDDLSCKNTTV